jgi:predicted DNA-binding transcriptional regulator YafY
VAFWKAEQLLALATLVAARHGGITLDDVIERFSVSKRTAQRMLHALEAQFTDINVSTDGEGCKRWHLPSGALRDLMSLSPEELAALEAVEPCFGNVRFGVTPSDSLRTVESRTPEED